jgi:hypothetical protein
MAVISKGIELYVDSFQGNALGSSSAKVEGLGYLLPGLQEVGELSGLATGSEREKIEVTTLADDKHVYTEGILVENEADTIDFTFLYDTQVFKYLQGEARDMATFNNKDSWTVRIPISYDDNGKATYTTFTFDADIVSLKVNSTSVNSAVTMSLTLKPAEAITVS